MGRPLRRSTLLALLASLFVASSSTAGGWSKLQDGEVAWLRTPAGERFFSIGVNVVDGEPDREPRQGSLQYRYSNGHATPEAWAVATRELLLGWGFNTLGGWSRRENEIGLPFTPVLSFGQQANAIWGDPFAPETAARMREEAKRRAARHSTGPLLLGVFTDNEIGWWNAPLLLWFLKQEPSNHTRRRLVEFLREHYDDFASFRRDFVVPPEVSDFDALEKRPISALLAAGGDSARTLRAWTPIVVGRYYAMAAAAAREAAPGALVLGDRLPIYWDEDALREAAKHLDVLAVNHDVATPGGWVAPYFFEGLRDAAPVPILVSEWFFASRENRSGNANRGQLMVVDTQAERARGAAAAARRFAAFPNVAGLHWFQLSDQPPGGRSDGEDYSHGLVDVHGVPYRGFGDALASANRDLAAIHAKARWQTPLPKGEPIAVPEAPAGFLEANATLDALDLDRSRLIFPRGRGDVPFADVHLSWTEDSLVVALLGQDFFDLALYEQHPVPLGDTFVLHLVVARPASSEPGAERRQVAIHFEPERLSQSPEHPPSEHHVQVYVPKGHVVENASETPDPRIAARRLRAIAPRIDGLIVVPRALLGLDTARAGEPLALEVAVRGFLRGRSFSLSGRPFDEAVASAPVVRATLAPEDGEPPFAGAPLVPPSRTPSR